MGETKTAKTVVTWEWWAWAGRKASAIVYLERLWKTQYAKKDRIQYPQCQWRNRTDEWGGDEKKEPYSPWELRQGLLWNTHPGGLQPIDGVGLQSWNDGPQGGEVLQDPTFLWKERLETAALNVSTTQTLVLLSLSPAMPAAHSHCWAAAVQILSIKNITPRSSHRTLHKLWHFDLVFLAFMYLWCHSFQFSK